jgi:hypothetical protein
VIEFRFKSVSVVISSCFVPNCVVVAKLREEITPSVISILVLPTKSQDTSSFSMVMFVPPVIFCCNPAAEITPSVISILVLPTKSQDTSSFSMVIFVPLDSSFCLSPITVKRLASPTKNELALILTPVISPVVVKSLVVKSCLIHLFLLMLYNLEQLEIPKMKSLNNL